MPTGVCQEFAFQTVGGDSRERKKEEEKNLWYIG
jgi:hypothetical protein